MKAKWLFISMIGGILSADAWAQNSKDAIVGEWLSAKKDTRFLIYESNDRYFGKILWSIEVEHGGNLRDVKNPNPQLRSRSIVGLILLKDFTFDGDNTWEKGTIYDPREGKEYACTLSLKSDNQLNVRGYVGLPLLGRTEVWTRIRK